MALNAMVTHPSPSTSAAAPLWRGGPRAPRARQAALLGALAVLLLCVALGWAAVSLGDVVASRPAFIVALPLLIGMLFAFVLHPQALVLAVVLLRGAADPVFQGTQLAGVGGLGGLVNLAVIALAAALVLRDRSRVPAAAWWAWLPFLLVQLGGLVHSPDPVPAARLVLGQISTAAMFFVAFHLVSDLRSLERALRLVVASSLPVAALTLVAIAGGNVASSLDGLETVSGRYGAPFPHPNILAFYLVLVIGVLLYLSRSLAGRAGALTWLAYAGYMLLLLGLLYATKTRSAWMAAALLFLLYGLLVERRYLVYLLLAPALAMLVPEFRDRVLDLGQGNAVVQYAKLNSFAWRQLIWTSGLEWMEPLRYLAGYGNHAFFVHSIDFFPLAGGRNLGAHSVYVQLFFDLGVLGVAAFVWLFWAAAGLMRPTLRLDRRAGVVFGALLVSYLVVAASDNLLGYLVFNWYFWFTIGAVCAAARQVTSPEPLR